MRRTRFGWRSAWSRTSWWCGTRTTAGAAGFWGAEDWQGVESAEGKAETAA